MPRARVGGLRVPFTDSFPRLDLVSVLVWWRLGGALNRVLGQIAIWFSLRSSRLFGCEIAGFRESVFFSLYYFCFILKILGSEFCPKFLPVPHGRTLVSCLIDCIAVTPDVRDV